MKNWILPSMFFIYPCDDCLLFIPWGGGGGGGGELLNSISFGRRRLWPAVQSLTFLCTILNRKCNPLIKPSWKNAALLRTIHVHANSNVLQLVSSLPFYICATWRSYCHVLSGPLPMYMCRPSQAVLYPPGLCVFPDLPFGEYFNTWVLRIFVSRSYIQ